MAAPRIVPPYTSPEHTTRPEGGSNNRPSCRAWPFRVWAHVVDLAAISDPDGVSLPAIHEGDVGAGATAPPHLGPSRGQWQSMTTLVATLS